MMIENHRTGLVWNLIRRCPHIWRGLRKAGFTGGWLESERVRLAVDLLIQAEAALHQPATIMDPIPAPIVQARFGSPG